MREKFVPSAEPNLMDSSYRLRVCVCVCVCVCVGGCVSACKMCPCVFHTCPLWHSSFDFLMLNDNFIMWVPPVVTTFPWKESWATCKAVIHRHDSSDLWPPLTDKITSQRPSHLRWYGSSSEVDKIKSLVNELPEKVLPHGIPRQLPGASWICVFF